ncbi:SRPBCC family protein [Paenibacillus sacheonensis]|uniref:Cell division protein n=1 Tax=Paenibacillus sacheonensis TaxID=742054 RepID=A0A7X5C3P1_9BACL|nr:ligand-binding SRPBCC domain-containing protein [Paenibacillus sacheonensis]NBC72540.1 cell division protein [Paenibacillus sacheonensis]
MVTVTTRIEIEAPIDLCFSLARDIDVHTRIVWKHTKEKAVGGVTSGPIGSGQTVTFEATHFGIRQRLTSKITAFEQPFRFTDEMQKGAFKRLRHLHEFVEQDRKTIMTDTLQFEAPLGFLGWMAERAVLRRYMQRFLEHRNEQLKQIAEAAIG